MNTSIKQVLQTLNVRESQSGVWIGNKALPAKGPLLESHSPVDGGFIGAVGAADAAGYQAAMSANVEAFNAWRTVPAPRRGEIVRQFGNELRAVKTELGALVSYEMGKSYHEGLGEVQEMLDICDFAVGLSRQLYGFTMHSERPGHRMYEQWHPLGVVGVISAFNFPVAVWAWNTALAWVCGDVTIWKPSSKVPLCAVACQQIIGKVLEANNLPGGISTLVCGNPAGDMINKDGRIPLISFTGSTRIGRHVAGTVAGRFGRAILELGGNNAIIVTENADLDLLVPAAVFGAVGTAGQRCTSTRRLIVQESVYERTVEKVRKAYAQLRVGNPLDERNHVGPLIDTKAVKDYLGAIEKAGTEGGKPLVEGGVLEGPGYESGCYVKPCVIAAKNDFSIVQQETFAPILYVMKYSSLEEGLSMNNNVPQGLSSAIFTNNMREAEKFLSAEGSDCGIANVNIGTSGAEIGGAFGGEKETGGGRESGSDSWKAYMRRQTNTINYTDKSPLAQGVKFELSGC